MTSWRRLRNAVVWTLLSTATAVSLALFGSAYLLRRKLRDELAVVRPERDRMRELLDSWERSRAEFDADQRTLRSVLRECREPTDIPRFPSGRIISDQRNGEMLILFVPAGEHSLGIRCRWGLAESPQAIAPPLESFQSGMQEWRVPLVGDTGYVLRLAYLGDGGPVGWELTGGDAPFASRSEQAPLAGLEGMGGSWSDQFITRRPNEMDVMTLVGLTGPMSLQAPAYRMSVTRNGLYAADAVLVDVKYEVWIESEGPRCVSAGEALQLIRLGQGERLAPYGGGGYYELRATGE